MNLKGKNFINLEDFNKNELLFLLDLAGSLKKKVKKGKKINLLDEKVLVMYFSKPSLRTRVSFEAGIKKLGGQAIVLKQDEVILGQRESIEDTARVLSRYADAVMIRTFDHADVEKFAKYSSVPVINALTDLSHPCQIMADLLTIKEHFKSFEGLKVAYIGDGNNVAHSMLVGCSILGIDISIASPKGYELNEDCLNQALEFAKVSNSIIKITNDPIEAADGANVLYTDVWTSMGQEDEAQVRREIFKNYQINSDLLKNAAQNHIVLHCLPAHKGEEISEETFELHADSIFEQAENRMHAQNAIMAAIMK